MNDYDRIEKAIHYINEHAEEQPSLDELAEYIGLSPYHFQKLFKRWAGVSPKRYLQYITAEAAKKILKSSASVLDTTFEVGLSSPSRLHDLFIHTDAVTPGQYKNGGEGVQIRYGFYKTPFGSCTLAQTDKGVCHLSFDNDLTTLKKEWPNADFINDDSDVEAINRIFYGGQSPLSVHLIGTNFQIKVWQAILNIPSGHLMTYGGLADKIGCPKASRAVGTALGQNKIGYLIPCHRVLRATGQPGGYRWGIERKKAMIAKEVSHSI